MSNAKVVRYIELSLCAKPERTEGAWERFLPCVTELMGFQAGSLVERLNRDAQDDQLNMAVCLWFPVKSDLSSAHD